MVCTALVQPGVQSLSDTYLLCLHRLRAAAFILGTEVVCPLCCPLLLLWFSLSWIILNSRHRSQFSNRRLRRHSPVTECTPAAPSGVSAGSENSIAVVICASTRPLVTSEECWQKTGKVLIINHSLEREEAAIHREREKA